MTMEGFLVPVLLMVTFCPTGIPGNPECLTCKKFSGKLKMDEAFVNITTNLKKPINLLGISSNCYLCPLQVLATNVTRESHIVVSTHYKYKLAVNSLDGSRICR
ncbi:uncharacterized protein LOC110251397 [Exaiptasia diaphana]|uniref:Uncharacterized protein n=1 Tax=Exaiptasia diaphana TaxID=2652724 RepID=A0A913Y391_EXADI|nr:uncharacterized protein LOC110251397 [Exaiptasia diaphana]